jgi:hypothetical protein
MLYMLSLGKNTQFFPGESLKENETILQTFHRMRTKTYFFILFVNSYKGVLEPRLM